MRQSNNIAIATQSGGSSINSAAIPALNLFGISAQAISTGTIVGTVKIQASNDDTAGSNTVPTNWSDVSSVVNITSGGGAFLIPRIDVCYQYLRVVYTFSSGAGNITVNVKSQGA